MKVLYVATVRSHIGQFHMPFISYLTEKGHIVEAAFKDNSNDKKGLDLSSIDKTYEIPFERNPFKISNIQAYFKLKKVINNGNYDIIHCHTPMGAVLTRLAAINARKKGTKVFYTAHGFHFYKGAPLKNWLLYFPVEKFLSRYTDVLITINDEDYNLALSKNFKSKKIIKVEGVGVDLSKFCEVSESYKQQVRREYKIAENCFVMTFAADLSFRKNQMMIINAIASIKDKIPNCLMLFLGQPILENEYKAACEKNGIENLVKFLGYRRDVDKLIALSDCIISSSMQEGLPINIIEAAARGKYIIATNVRGNRDVVLQSRYGCLVELNDVEELAKQILNVYSNGIPKRIEKGDLNVYSQDSIIKKLKLIYGID